MSNKCTSKSNLSFAEKSNLHAGELRGLNSLQKPVANDNVVVCETYKSGKLCVLTKEQYLASGKTDCQKHLEITPTDVVRLQKYVNANVEWLNDFLS